jgi:hypothetical protein
LGAIVAAAAVSTSIWLNPPSENRARALDQVRLNDLQQVEFAINRHYNLHHALPVDLQILESENELLAQQNWHDPVTKQPYEFDISSGTSYQLCANFSRSSGKAENGYDYQSRRHSAGRACFQYRVGQ